MPLSRSLIFLLPLLVLNPIACGKNPLEPSAQLTVESEHFIFESDVLKSSESEMTEGVARAELLFSLIADYVGPSRSPAEKIVVNLEGDFEERGPYFDTSGVHLYRYSEQEGGYWSLMAHEMVHAFRVDWYVSNETWNWPTAMYFDEGFAEFIAQRIEPSKTGFPFYGFPEDVVVGYWVTSDRHVPLDVLRNQHEDLNRPCQFQAYPERASWMRYINEVYGRESLLEIVYARYEPTSLYIQDQIGVSLEQLDANWEVWIGERFSEVVNADDIAKAYRDRTSWARICVAGVDY